MAVACGVRSTWELGAGDIALRYSGSGLAFLSEGSGVRGSRVSVACMRWLVKGPTELQHGTCTQSLRRAVMPSPRCDPSDASGAPLVVFVKFHKVGGTSMMLVLAGEPGRRLARFTGY